MQWCILQSSLNGLFLLVYIVCHSLNLMPEGLRICLLSPKNSGKIPPSSIKNGGLSMTRKGSWLWEFISRDMGSVQYSFMDITPNSTLIHSSSTLQNAIFFLFHVCSDYQISCLLVFICSFLDHTQGSHY